MCACVEGGRGHQGFVEREPYLFEHLMHERARTQITTSYLIEHLSQEAVIDVAPDLA